MEPSEPDLRVQHEEDTVRGAFFIEKDGQRLAEQVYLRKGGNRAVIVHTEVRPQLQGRGVARRLLDAAVAWARENGMRMGATCRYAKAQFERDASLRDVYEPGLS